MLINRLNRFMAMFIAMFMICAVPSCGFGDDEDEDDGIDMPQNPNAPQMLIGTWNMYGLKYTFNTDGTGYITGDFDADDLKTTANPLLSSRSGRSTIPFTYIYNEAEQTIVFNRDEEIWRIVNLTVDILVVIDSEGNELTLVKEGAANPGKPGDAGKYPPCPKSTLIGDWGMAGQKYYGFTSEGVMKWYWSDGDGYDSEKYSYDEKTGKLLTADGVNMSVKKVSDDVIIITDNNDPDYSVLLARVTGKAFTVGDISLLYNKTWSVVSIAAIDDETVYTPMTYYFDSKGTYSVCAQNTPMGGTFTYDSGSKTLTLNMYGEKTNFEILNLTENDVVMRPDGGELMEMVVLP